MSLAFWSKFESASSNFNLISAHSKRIFGPDSGYLAEFRRGDSRYFTVKTDLDNFIATFLAKKTFASIELERLQTVKNPTDDDYQILEKVCNNVEWLGLALHGDDNFSGDFRSHGLLNFLAGVEREKLPALRILAILAKHALFGKTL